MRFGLLVNRTLSMGFGLSLGSSKRFNSKQKSNSNTKDNNINYNINANYELQIFLFKKKKNLKIFMKYHDIHTVKTCRTYIVAIVIYSFSGLCLTVIMNLCLFLCLEEDHI